MPDVPKRSSIADDLALIHARLERDSAKANDGADVAECLNVAFGSCKLLALDLAEQRDEARAELERLRAGQTGDEGDIRARVAEEIARAIEVDQGKRCPECDGLPASLKWGPRSFVRIGRCGAGHTWTADHAKGQWRNVATIAREHAVAPGPVEPVTDGGQP